MICKFTTIRVCHKECKKLAFKNEKFENKDIKPLCMCILLSKYAYHYALIILCMNLHAWGYSANKFFKHKWMERVHILNYCMYADKYFLWPFTQSHLSVTLMCLSWSLTEDWLTSMMFSVFSKSFVISCSCSSTAATAICRMK